jgi:hypothetical protein
MNSPSPKIFSTDDVYIKKYIEEQGLSSIPLEPPVKTKWARVIVATSGFDTVCIVSCTGFDKDDDNGLILAAWSSEAIDKEQINRYIDVVLGAIDVKEVTEQFSYRIGSDFKNN